MNSCNQKHTIYTGETVGLVLAMYEDDGKNQVVVSYVNVATILKPSEQVGWVIGNVQVFSNEDPFVN